MEVSIDLSMFFESDPITGESIEKPRPPRKTWEDVGRVIRRHQGKRPDVVEKLIRAASDTSQWDWYFNEYKPWLKKCEERKEMNENRRPDPMTGEQPAAWPMPPLPGRPIDRSEEFREYERQAQEHFA